MEENASLTLVDPNPSTSIAIDGIVQNQLRRKNLQLTLGESVGINTTTLQISSSINSVVNGDVINIDDEYILIKSVGVVGDDVIEIEREVPWYNRCSTHYWCGYGTEW